MIHILIGKRDEYIDISKIEWEIKIVIDTKYLKKKQLVSKQIRCQSVSVGLEGAKRRDDYNMKLLRILNTKKKYSVKEVRSLWYMN